MKTKLFTIVSGIAICLITSIGVNTELEYANEAYKSENTHELTFCEDCLDYIDSCNLECEIEQLEIRLFKNTIASTVINPSDINVIEYEDEIDISIVNQKS